MTAETITAMLDDAAANGTHDRQHRAVFPTPELGPIPRLTQGERKRLGRALDGLDHFADEDEAKAPLAFLHGVPWTEWHAMTPERRRAYIRRSIIERLVSKRAANSRARERGRTHPSRPTVDGKPTMTLAYLEEKVKALVSQEMNRRAARSTLTDEALTAQRSALTAQFFDELTRAHTIVERSEND